MMVWQGNIGWKLCACPASVPTVSTPDTENVALLCQERHALRMESGSVRSVRTGVEKFLGPEPMRPVGADEYPGMRGDAAVLALPFHHPLAGQQEVGICRRLCGDIDDAGRPDEAIDRNIVSRIVRVVLPVTQ